MTEGGDQNGVSRMSDEAVTGKRGGGAREGGGRKYEKLREGHTRVKYRVARRTADVVSLLSFRENLNSCPDLISGFIRSNTLGHGRFFKRTR